MDRERCEDICRKALGYKSPIAKKLLPLVFVEVVESVKSICSWFESFSITVEDGKLVT
jgi:hypothetical protein